MSMLYITLIFALFATTNARLIGSDPTTWTPKNIADPSNTIHENSTDTWTPVTTKWSPIISYSSIIVKDYLEDYLEAALEDIDRKIEQYKQPIVTINKIRDLDDEKLPKALSNIMDWFKGKKIPVNYSNRRLLL